MFTPHFHRTPQPDLRWHASRLWRAVSPTKLGWGRRSATVHDPPSHFNSLKQCCGKLGWSLGSKALQQSCSSGQMPTYSSGGNAPKPATCVCERNARKQSFVRDRSRRHFAPNRFICTDAPDRMIAASRGNESGWIVVDSPLKRRERARGSGATRRSEPFEVYEFPADNRVDADPRRCAVSRYDLLGIRPLWPRSRRATVTLFSGTGCQASLLTAN